MIAVESNPEASAVALGWFLKGIVPPDGHDLKISIPEGKFQVGRRPDLHLCLPVPSVSKLHAELVATDFALFVRDLGSTNGTFINGQRITQDTPLNETDVIQFAEYEFVVGRTHVADSMKTCVCDSGEWVQTLTRLHRLLNEKAIIPHFQPIVELADAQIIGYEILARSALPGLMSPREMFEAAERMNLASRLSVLCRETGVENSRKLSSNLTLFLNTHPCEGTETELLESLFSLRVLAPNQRIVLELHEAAITRPREVAEFRKRLRDLRIELAYDDFGAGQSRLLELADVPPDYLKFDMSLIRGIHQSSHRQQIVAGLVRVASDLNIKTVAEGIENTAEATTCRNIGFTHAQGYFFGKPTSVDALRSD